ncbi:unnamed protein product [Rotaria socialis]|uniref:Xanthine/uracil/vitamin C permease n=1 Tax=Rotaria socialis TaxID=392032 RepID=A0A818B543_9BILA|nr:unnamed protein product [Rotaria socialis]CAF3316437.1 unnamed protein product [Rotaria socialis]CAF3368759.1 unnamed protein product [Rotaria socialis]CAF3407718.1 unnamed protein product [Rotaria socialis]CAF3415474.1 unnamed protein product [Rotaria socialis]
MSMPMEISNKTFEADINQDETIAVTKQRRFLKHCRKIMIDEPKKILSFQSSEWISAFRFNSSYPLFTRGDIDGFVALFINNLATLLSVIMGLQPTLGNDIVYGKILPGVGLSMIWGNFYYVYMARKLSYKEKRGDVCTMPYGINTPGAFAFIYVIILPTYNHCMLSHEKNYCQEMAWYVALASNFVTGIILLLLCFFGEFIRKKTPSVALLSSISGLGFVYLALNQFFPLAAIPMESYIPLAIVMLGYFGGVKYGPFPVAFLALVTGTALGWITPKKKVSAVVEALDLVKGYQPVFPITQIFQHFKFVSSYLSTTIPTAISIAIGTIQCVESAKRAGDFYPTREVMFADGVGTLIASLFGSVFGMTTYIGHPAFKKMGARQAYSIMNGLAYLPLCFLGITALLMSMIAIVSINPIIIFIGLVICADTLSITPQRHYPAFLLGIMSIVAEWAHSTIVDGVTTAYKNFTVSNVDFSNNITSNIVSYPYSGLVNFAGGSQLQCIFITAIMMYMIDRKFVHAAFWSFLASIFAFFGLINSSRVGILVNYDDNGWRFTIAYLSMSALFGLLELGQRHKWVKEPETEPDDLSSIEWAEWKRLQKLEEPTGTTDKMSKVDV